MTMTTSSEDLGITLSNGAGRLLFALLLSQQEVPDVYRLANVPRKQVTSLLAEIHVHPPDPEYAVDANSKGLETLMSHSIPHQSQLDLGTNDQESEVEAACTLADHSGSAAQQALAVIDAWKLFFPNVNKVQELQPRKAKEWIKLAGSATTVFGIMGGVEERLLQTKEFPLAYMNKVIGIKVKEAQQSIGQESTAEDEGVMDAWRVYAHKLVEQGKSNHGDKNRTANLQRITGTIGGSTGRA